MTELAFMHLSYYVIMCTQDINKGDPKVWDICFGFIIESTRKYLR